MADFLFLMHDDVARCIDTAAWPAYFAMLREKGVFQGGSSIGKGQTFRHDATPAPLTPALGGYIKVTAASLDEAATLLAGNPVYEAGGTVEIRALPRD